MTDRVDILSDKIYLYHGFRRISDVPEIDNGSIAYKGEGAGGQGEGFYFFVNKEKTQSYLGEYYHSCADLNSHMTNLSAVIVQTEISADDMKYPDWQFDYEAVNNDEDSSVLSDGLKNLFVRYLPEVSDIKKDLGEVRVRASAEKLSEQVKSLVFADVQETPHKNVFRILVNGRPLYDKMGLLAMDVMQKVNDYMCEHCPAYREEYNQLLRQALTCSKNSALKYTGDKKLKVSAVFDITGASRQGLTDYFLKGGQRTRLPVSEKVLPEKAASSVQNDTAKLTEEDSFFKGKTLKGDTLEEVYQMLALDNKLRRLDEIKEAEKQQNASEKKEMPSFLDNKGKTDVFSEEKLSLKDKLSKMQQSSPKTSPVPEQSGQALSETSARQQAGAPEEQVKRDASVEQERRCFSAEQEALGATGKIRALPVFFKTSAER